MDVVRIFNGLGNQMSQYAFYLTKKCNAPMTTFWVPLPPDFSRPNQHNGFELDKVFGIKRHPIIECFFIKFYGYSQANNWRRFVNMITDFVIENENYDYDSSFIHPHNIFKINYFYGGWHSEKYFRNIRELLLKSFSFDNTKLNQKSCQWEQIIKEDSHSCSLHIRRGDFLNDPSLCNIASTSYYEKAIEEIKKVDERTVFYVFSDEINWCRMHFGSKGFFYIDCNKGKDSWQDMYLMSICCNHINSNSTFSWWGAWLCTLPSSVTIVPSQFMNKRNIKDVYPESWIKI